MSGTDRQSEAVPATGGWSSLLFLVGLVTLLVSLVAYAADLVTGHDVLPSTLLNALAALGLVGWAARDTLTDPESAVDSRGGAASTALLLYGLYLLLASLVVAATNPWHGRLSVALGATAVGMVAILVGFLGFPRERLLGAGDTPEDSDVEPAATDDPSE